MIQMPIKIGDKVKFTNDEENLVHIVKKVYEYEEDVQSDIVIACSCDHWVEDHDVVKVDNETTITCPECVKQLKQV